VLFARKVEFSIIIMFVINVVVKEIGCCIGKRKKNYLKGEGRRKRKMLNDKEESICPFLEQGKICTYKTGEKNNGNRRKCGYKKRCERCPFFEYSKTILKEVEDEV